MRMRPITFTAGLILILASSLIISCSSAPKAAAIPASNFSEPEAISLAREYYKKNDFAYGALSCFGGKTDPGWMNDPELYSVPTFSHIEKASYKPSGIWLVTANSTWAVKYKKSYESQGIKAGDIRDFVADCVYRVDDTTGKVLTD